MGIDSRAFNAAVKGMVKATAADTKAELAKDAALLRAQAKANASGSPREKEGRRFSVGTTKSGRARMRTGGGSRQGGPGVRSGRLRAGIRATAVRQRGNSFSVQVGASRLTPYARSIEMGNPRWKGHPKYPFMQPAYRAVKPQFARDIRTTWAAAITGSRSRQTID